MTRIIESLDDIAGGYDALFCDLWGCYHNGVAPYPAAVAALRAFRAKPGGGIVVLLTNAPRPSKATRAHLASIGGPPDSYDAIVSSGDATRSVLETQSYGRRMHIVGPDRDTPIWEGLDLEQVGLEAAEAILCTGLFDDRVETPDDYAELVAEGVRRDLPFLCANPDVIVDRGETRLYCAGAIAEVYAAGGGRVFLFGKPHAPIYALASRRLAEIRADIPPQRILCIGDGVATDVLGAEQAGLDCVFVTGGLAAREVSDDPERPDPARLAAYLERHGRAPAFAIGRLR